MVVILAHYQGEIKGGREEHRLIIEMSLLMLPRTETMWYNHQKLTKLIPLFPTSISKSTQSATNEPSIFSTRKFTPSPKDKPSLLPTRKPTIFLTSKPSLFPLVN